eukprot:jgi/Bigna1/144133/aug1.84_g18841
MDAVKFQRIWESKGALSLRTDSRQTKETYTYNDIQELSDSEKMRLRKALVIGRRKLSVKDLAKNLKMDRAALLQIFKDYASDPVSVSNMLSSDASEEGEHLSGSSMEEGTEDQDVVKKKVIKIPFYERKRLGTLDMIYEKERSSFDQTPSTFMPYAKS